MTSDPKRIAILLADYLAGPQVLRNAVSGLTEKQLLARPVPGKWSVHEVVCHLSDCEVIYVDRMTRVIAEERPTLMNVDPDVHVPALAKPERNIDEELLLVDTLRRHMARILQTLRPEDFQRVGIHSQDGPLTLETLLSRITGHIPHHAKFIGEKRVAMGVG